MCLTPRSIGVFQPGGHASHVLVPEPRHLVPIGSLPAPLAATYACSGLTAFSAVKKTLPAAPDDPIVVIGIGGLGLSAVSILRALGHERIIAVDVSAGNREAALRAGATDALDGATVPLAPALVETAGPGGIGAVIDFVNNTTTSRAGFDALRRGGILVAVGFFGGELAIGLPLLPLRALTVQGSYVGSPADLRSLVELAEGGKLPAIPVASVAQHAATGVLAQLRDGKITGRVVLDAAARYPAATAGSAPAADFATSTP
jgi:alcohol dehydrogenase/propanol-preferring alcohol dehydrogenase